MDNLKELLGDDLYKQLADKVDVNKYIFGVKENYIPKHRFDEVNNSLKDYKEQVTQRDTQLDELSKQAKGDDELTKKLNDMTEANSKFEERLTLQQRDFEIDKAIIQSKAKNPKALKALLDMEKLKLDDGKLSGIEEQLKAIKDSDSYMFNDDILIGTGKDQGKQEKTQDFNKERAQAIRLRY
jgi:hypothetical protein